MEGREKKEKKGGDEGLNGFKLPFPLASSFHSSSGLLLLTAMLM
jgi:hypothetical protein